MAPAVAEFRLGSLGLRVISALVMAPIAIAAILAGLPFFGLLVALGCAVLAWEWVRLCAGGGLGLDGWIVAAAVLAGVAVAAAGKPRLALAVILCGAIIVFLRSRLSGGAHALWLAAGVLYLGVPSTALLWLRAESGAGAVLWLFLAVWATDIGAYAAGRLIGGPRLAPRLSPNKTWAGLLGGILLAAATGLLVAAPLGLANPGSLAGLSVAVALVSQAGDLTESAIKRHFKVKDASGLIPGHGGLFDRVDGLLAAAPMMALVQLISGGGALAWR